MMRLIAHQGGWDEILIVAIPALALLYGLRRAERRARREAEAREESPPDARGPEEAAG